MKIGDTVFVRGYVDEIRKDTIIVRNDGGYFGTVPSEIICGDMPERKTGKWIEYDSDEDKYDIIKCPCCKNIFTVDSFHWTDIGFIKDDFKFCPNCGADMRGNEK